MALGFFYFRGGCTDNVVENNISASTIPTAATTTAGANPNMETPSNNTDDFNCYFPGKPNPPVKPGPNDLSADPRFVDAKKNDYRLRDDSPCCAAGTDVGLALRRQEAEPGGLLTTYGDETHPFCSQWSDAVRANGSRPAGRTARRHGAARTVPTRAAAATDSAPR